MANNTVHTGAAQPIETEYTYLKGSNVYGGTTTPLVQTVKQGNKTTVYKDLNLTWADGRKLKEVKNNTVLLASYTYDQNGNRIAKQTADTGVDYYQKNLQGDVVGLVDSNGNQMVSYTYDSWGKPYSVTGTKAATLGVLNPFRYRSYVYDEETGWYYLKSRYYDPEVGRFINADSIIPGTKMTVQGYNLYSYCQNDPVNMEDTEGMTPTRCGPLKSASYYIQKQGNHMKSVSAYGNPDLRREFLIEDIEEDLKNFNLLNDDPKKVFIFYQYVFYGSLWRNNLMKLLKKIFIIISFIICVPIMSYLYAYFGEMIYEWREAHYYSEKDNFITEEVIIETISCDFKYNTVYMNFGSHEHGYGINGKNAMIILESDMLREIKAGDKITVTYCPTIFGDGYVCPVVGVSVNGNEILSFEEGYSNFIKQYE